MIPWGRGAAAAGPERPGAARDDRQRARLPLAGPRAHSSSV